MHVSLYAHGRCSLKLFLLLELVVPKVWASSLSWDIVTLLSKSVILIYCFNSSIWTLLLLYIPTTSWYCQFLSTDIFRRNLIVLICISEISSEVEHIFICLLDVHISSNTNYLFTYLDLFFPLVGLSFFLLICMSFSDY